METTHYRKYLKNTIRKPNQLNFTPDALRFTLEQICHGFSSNKLVQIRPLDRVAKELKSQNKSS